MTIGAAGCGDTGSSARQISDRITEANVSRSIFAITIALVMLAASQASAGGYYVDGPDGYYPGGYGYYEPPYRGFYGYAPGYAYRDYYGPIPLLSALFGPGPRCQHRVPVLNYQGEVRDGWINGC